MKVGARRAALEGKVPGRHVGMPTASRALCGALIVLASLVVAGCETVYDLPSAKDTTPGIEFWKCGDYFDGCGLLSGDCVTLTANVHDGTGEVTFGDFVERTEFHIDGIERRWNWCMADDYSYRCSFIISVDGTGRYYRFIGTGETAKPRDLFKCTRR